MFLAVNKYCWQQNAVPWVLGVAVALLVMQLQQQDQLELASSWMHAALLTRTSVLVTAGHPGLCRHTSEPPHIPPPVKCQSRSTAVKCTLAHMTDCVREQCACISASERPVPSKPSKCVNAKRLHGGTLSVQKCVLALIPKSMQMCIQDCVRKTAYVSASKHLVQVSCITDCMGDKSVQ